MPHYVGLSIKSNSKVRQGLYGILLALACARAWGKLFHFSLPLICLPENEVVRPAFSFSVHTVCEALWTAVTTLQDTGLQAGLSFFGCAHTQSCPAVCSYGL